MIKKKIPYLFIGLFLCLSLTLAGCGGGKSAAPTYYAYLANFNNDNISIFKQEANGTLSPILTPVPTGSGSNPIWSVASPNGKYLYVSCYNAAQILCFQINADGSLTALPVGTTSTGSYAKILRVNPSGTHLYAIYGHPNMATPFSIGADGILTKIGSGASAGTGSNDIAFTPDGNYAYVTNSSGDNVLLYSVANDGSLSIGLNFAAGDAPNCLAIHPAGSYLYALNCNSSSISMYKINSTDGQLSFIDDANKSILIGGYPEDIIISADGKYVYTANFGGNYITALKVNENGVLTSINTYSTEAGPMALTIDPTKQYLYAVNRNANSISIFKIQNDGSLLDTGTTIPTGDGTQPYKLTFVKAQ